VGRRIRELQAELERALAGGHGGGGISGVHRVAKKQKKRLVPKHGADHGVYKLDDLLKRRRDGGDDDDDDEGSNGGGEAMV